MDIKEQELKAMRSALRGKEHMIDKLNETILNLGQEIKNKTLEKNREINKIKNKLFDRERKLFETKNRNLWDRVKASFTRLELNENT